MEEMIPITMFLVIGLVIAAYFYWNHKSRLALLGTVQSAVEAGNALTPELLARLGTAADPRIRDLRRGVILLSIGIAGLLGSSFFNDPDVLAGIRAGSMLPLMVGLGFLLVWKLTPNQV